MASITTTGAPAGAPPERHPVDEVLPPQLMVTYGLQHVLSMAAGVIAVRADQGNHPAERACSA